MILINLNFHHYQMINNFLISVLKRSLLSSRPLLLIAYCNFR
jgi:hypothetical protein